VRARHVVVRSIAFRPCERARRRHKVSLARLVNGHAGWILRRRHSAPAPNVDIRGKEDRMQADQDREKLTEAQRLVAESRDQLRREQTLRELDQKLEQLEGLLRAMQL